MKGVSCPWKNDKQITMQRMISSKIMMYYYCVWHFLSLFGFCVSFLWWGIYVFIKQQQNRSEVLTCVSVSYALFICVCVCVSRVNPELMSVVFCHMAWSWYLEIVSYLWVLCFFLNSVWICPNPEVFAFRVIDYCSFDRKKKKKIITSILC